MNIDRIFLPLYELNLFLEEFLDAFHFVESAMHCASYVVYNIIYKFQILLYTVFIGDSYRTN